MMNVLLMVIVMAKELQFESLLHREHSAIVRVLRLRDGVDARRRSRLHRVHRLQRAQTLLQSAETALLAHHRDGASVALSAHPEVLQLICTFEYDVYSQANKE